jgi:hypothetical protein
MASGPAQPPPPEQPHGDGAGARSKAQASEPDAQASAAGERFGPLTVTRVSKDDGRALILYGHDESHAELDDDAAAAEPKRQDDPS